MEKNIPSTETSELAIDLEQIIRSRAGKLGRWIPTCLINWLKRFIHQDFINEFLVRGYEGVEFCQKGVEYLGAHITVEGRGNLPDDGRAYTFVSNHPLGAIDGVTLGGLIGEHYNGKVKYLVNDLLMNLKGLAPLCIPINKLGSQTRSSASMIEQAFASDNHIIMFPAGLCSRLINGQIRDIPWSKAFLKRSVKAKRDIVPIHFVGQNSPRFYRVALWCKRLHLPNFAMLLLPDEMYRSNGTHYTVRIGKPIPYQTFDRTRSTTEWAAWVQDEVYKL